jgi:hypothetical protein
MKYDKEVIAIRIFEAFVLLCIIYVFAYHVLKKTGVINTPLWIELSQPIAALLGAAAIVIGIVEFYVKLKDLPKSHEKLAQRVDRMAVGLTRLEKDVEYIRNDVDIVKNDVKYLMKCKNCQKLATPPVKHRWHARPAGLGSLALEHIYPTSATSRRLVV